MNQLKIPILVCGDQRFSQSVCENLKNSQPDIPWKFDIFDNGTSALILYRQHNHSIALIQEELPGMGGVQLAKELLKISGETTIFLFTKENQHDLHGVETINWPPVSWTSFSQGLLQNLPIEFQNLWSHTQKDNPLHISLQKYAEKYRNQTQNEKKDVICIPSFIKTQNSQAEDKILTESNTQTLTKSSPEIQTTKNQLPDKWELGLLIFLFVSCSISWFFPNGEEYIAYVSFRYFMTAILISSIIGFFVSRFSNKI